MQNHSQIVLILVAVGLITSTFLMQQDVKAPTSFRSAPPLVAGDNIYVAWWSNNTINGNNEVLFRMSTDSGASFSDKINLSNTNDSESERVDLDSDGESVVVTWWETNQTDEIPIMRVSNDNGETFGPLLRLGANGTIGEAEETED
ncbi:MAG: hypothetical protein ACRD8Z_10765 [Nitrososphaeraceae archaeon]